MDSLGPVLVQAALSDARLIESARAGSPEALGALYDRYGEVVFQVVLRLTGSGFDAEDVLHDLFVGLPEALQRYDEQGSFGAWLKRVAVRLALMRLRARRRRGEVPLETAGPARTRDGADHRLKARELWSAVAALPESIRMVFVLKWVEGYTHDEIASLLGISPGASRVRLSRALEALRETLRGRDRS